MSSVGTLNFAFKGLRRGLCKIGRLLLEMLSAAAVLFFVWQDGLLSTGRSFCWLLSVGLLSTFVGQIFWWDRVGAAAALLMLFWRGSPAFTLRCGFCVVFCFGVAAMQLEWWLLFSRFRWCRC
jgi:hypothetical protein